MLPKRSQSLMRANSLLLTVAITAAVVGFAGFYVVGNRSSETRERVAQAQCSVEACVSISGGNNVPDVITIKSGGYVQFNSVGDEKHNLALAHSAVQHEDTSTYESGDFGKDEAWKVQFKKDGTYSFRDKYNESVEISVVVYTPGKDYSIQ